MSQYDLEEYAKAKVVVKDFKKLFTIIEDMQAKLYPFTRYALVADIMRELNDVGIGLDITYKYYKKVLENKGKVDE